MLYGLNARSCSKGTALMLSVDMASSAASGCAKPSPRLPFVYIPPRLLQHRESYARGPGS